MIVCLCLPLESLSRPTASQGLGRLRDVFMILSVDHSNKSTKSTGGPTNQSQPSVAPKDTTWVLVLVLLHLSSTKNCRYLISLIWPVAAAQLVEQLTNDSKFKGSNPVDDGTWSAFWEKALIPFKWVPMMTNTTSSITVGIKSNMNRHWQAWHSA